MSASEFFIILEARAAGSASEPSIAEGEIARAVALGKKLKRRFRSVPVFCGPDLLQVQTADALHDALKGKLRVLSALALRGGVDPWRAAWKEIFSGVPSGVLVMALPQWNALSAFLELGAFPAQTPLCCVHLQQKAAKTWVAETVE